MTIQNIPTESTPQTGAQQAASPNASQTAPAGASQGQDVPAWFLTYKAETDARIANAEKVSRSKQSEIDKVISTANKRSKADIDAEVSRATVYGGLSPEQAAAYRGNLVADAIQQQYFNDQSAAALPGNEAQATPAPLDEYSVLQKSKLSTSDPEVAQAVLAANGDPIALAMSLGALTEKRASTPPPSTGINAGIPSGTPPAPPDPNDISGITDSRKLYEIAGKNIKRRGAAVPS